MDYNKVIVAGRLAADPESREVNAGGLMKTVTKFTVVVNDFRNKTSGPVYLDCEAWNRSAEIVRDHFRKGGSIFVEGYLRLDRWKDQQGQKRSKLKVVVQEIKFTDSKRSDDDPVGPPSEEPAF